MRTKKQLSNRHKAVLNRTITILRNSEIAPYVNDLILFGSCSRGEQKFSSDIDLLLVLDAEFKNKRELKRPLRILKADVLPEELDDPDVDLKVVVGDEWESSKMLFYKNIRRDGISLWH